MISVTVNGDQIALGRLQLMKRAVEIIQNKHPDIDWNSNDLMITVVPKTEDKPEGV